MSLIFSPGQLAIMIFTSIFCFVAASATLAAAAGTEMHGLSRLLNGTLAGRATFPNEGIHGVNLGSWLVFGVWRVALKSPRRSLHPSSTQNLIWPSTNGALWYVTGVCGIQE
jgi:hypothetical protein